MMVRSILVVQIDLMGQRGGWEWGVDEIGEGVAMIGHSGGYERVVVLARVYFLFWY